MELLCYRAGETFERNGHHIEITRDSPWNSWGRWGDILVDGVALKPGDSGSRVNWQFDEMKRRYRARGKVV